MKGFSLLETIFAITILGIGFAGAIALINRTIFLGSEVTSQLVAANLAQEGMEVVHNIRNTNWIEQKDVPGTPWDDGLIDGISCVQFDSLFLITPCDGEARRLYLAGSRYVHDEGGTFTDFRRYVEILRGVDDMGTPADPSDDVPYVGARSVVEWKDKSINVEERLYNWK